MVLRCSNEREFLVSTLIEQLADFSVRTNWTDLPSTVRERVRLQHVHISAAVRESVPEPVTLGFMRHASPRGSARLFNGKSTSARAAAQIHAARAAYVDRLDHVLGGCTGVGAVVASWAYAKLSTVEQILLSTAVANEVAGRIGASMLLGPHHGFGSGWVHAVSAAVSAGKMLELTVTQMTEAISMALSTAGPIPRSVLASSGRSFAVGSAVGSGVEAAQLAQKGGSASYDQLAAPGGLLESACWLPLPHAFTGLGEAWLTQTVTFPRWPGPVVWHSAYDALSRVLARHVKAADKRLRADQVKEIHLKVPAPAVALDAWVGRFGVRSSAGLPHAVRHAMGALVAQHSLGVMEMEHDHWVDRRGLYGDVAGRVRIEHDLSLTLEFMAQVVHAIAPLIGGITEPEWRSLIDRVARPEVGWPTIKWSDARSFIKHRPDKWLQKIRFAPVSLSDGQFDEWQLRLGAHISVYTTRGGKWPESVSIPDCSPGTSWNDTIVSVHSLFAKGDENRMKTCHEIWCASESETAEDWVNTLLE